MQKVSVMKFVLSRVGVYAASLVSHLFLLLLGTSGIFGTPLGDITYTYEPWSKNMVEGALFFGLDSDWVYPWVNLLPIMFPRYLADASGFSYFAIWIVGSIALDLVALWALLGWSGKPSRSRIAAGFAWVGLQFLLGPVAISRLDNLSIALAVIGIGALLNAKDEIAAVWFAFATWVKIWPAALILALLASTKKLRQSFEASQIVLVGILLIGFFIGQFHSISFLFAQSDRGLQVESVAATFWLWQALAGMPDTKIYFDGTYITFQIQGQGVEIFTDLLSIVFYVALGITAWLAYKARANENSSEVFAWVAMTATLDMIVFNKVGSPQYIGWLFVPVIFAIAKNLRSFRPVGITVAVTSALTFLIYPVFYDAILASEFMPTVIITVRNLLLVFMLVQANLELMKLGKQVSEQRAD